MSYEMDQDSIYTRSELTLLDTDSNSNIYSYIVIVISRVLQM